MINSFVIGTGKKHIWMHGLLGNCLNLSPLARSQNGMHFLIDARNHGSSFHQDGMDYKVLAEDVKKFMSGKGIDKAVMVGHSMGGKTAMALALLWPECVEAVCVLDIAPVSYSLVMEEYYGYVRQYLKFIKDTQLDGKTRKDVEQIALEKFQDVKIMQLIASNLRQNENGLEWRIGFQQLFNGIQDVGSWSIPGKYTGPFQAIVGSNSIHTCKSPLLSSSLPVSSLYSPQFPSASIEIINNAGHFLHVDQAESVKKSITKFLSSLSN